MREAMVRVGDRFSDAIAVEEKVLAMAKGLDADIREGGAFFADQFADALVASAEAQPGKGVVYATILALVQLTQPRAAQECLGRVETRLCECIVQGDVEGRWYGLSNLLHLACYLVHCHMVTAASVVDYLTRLAEAAKAEREPNATQYHVAVLLCTVIPIAAERLCLEADFEGLLDEVRVLVDVALQYKPETFQREKVEAKGTLQTLFESMMDLAEKEWSHDAPLDPYNAFSKLTELQPKTLYGSFGNTFNVVHDVPLLELVGCQLHQICSLTSTSVPAAAFRYLVVVDAMLVSYFKSAEVAAQRLLKAEAYVSTEPLGHLLVPILFSYLVVPPSTAHPPTYYASILVQLVQLDAKNTAPILGRTVNAMYQNLDAYESESRDRLAQWFGLHLSQFGVQWPWEAWTESIATPSVQTWFLRRTLRQTAVLLTPQTVATAVPTEFHALFMTKEEGIDEGTSATAIKWINGTDALETGADPALLLLAVLRHWYNNGLCALVSSMTEHADRLRTVLSNISMDSIDSVDAQFPLHIVFTRLLVLNLIDPRSLLEHILSDADTADRLWPVALDTLANTETRQKRMLIAMQYIHLLLTSPSTSKDSATLGDRVLELQRRFPKEAAALRETLVSTVFTSNADSKAATLIR